MRRRNQLVQGVSNLIETQVGQRLEGLIKTGEVVRVAGSQAFVKIDGSVGIKPAILAVDAQAGERCVLTRASETHKWMVTGRIPRDQQPAPEFNPTLTGELSPPAGFNDGSGWTNVILWGWSTPPQKPVAVEVQVADDSNGTNAASVLITRGSYLLYPSATAKWARARSVGPHFEVSAWTAWTEGTPGSASGGPGTDTTAIHDDVANEISALTEKSTPVGADLLLIEDSAASYVKKKVQFTNLPGGTDPAAIHDNVSGEIHAITGKTTPTGADEVLIEDSAATYAKKQLTLTNLVTWLKGLVKLDEWAATTDVTTNNASTSAHGLLLKLNNSSTQFLNGQGSWATPPTGGGGAELLYSAFCGSVSLSGSEQSLIVSPQAYGSLTIPSGTITVGGVLHLRMIGSFNVSNATQTFRVKFSGGEIFVQAAITFPTGQAGYWEFDYPMQMVSDSGYYGNDGGIGLFMTSYSSTQAFTELQAYADYVLNNVDQTMSLTVQAGGSGGSITASNIMLTWYPS